MEQEIYLPNTEIPSS